MNRFQNFFLHCFAILFFIIGCSAPKGTIKERRGTLYKTPEEALEAFKAAFRSGDVSQLVAVFGEEGKNIISSGDPVADRAIMKRFSRRLDERAELIPVKSDDFQHEQWFKLRFGNEAWPMRIPLANQGDGWYFAVHHAKQAAQETRLAINQLNAIYSLVRLTKAQREFFEGDSDDDSVHEYAQKIFSAEGAKDGLYWSTADGGSKSPLDAAITRAIDDGYRVGADKSQSYEGYVFKILPSQGKNARGGEYSYMEGPNMTKGFAVLAYPRVWNGTGQLSYLASPTGQLYKKDLGFKTDSLAKSTQTFNPDTSWFLVDRREYGEVADNPFKS